MRLYRAICLLAVVALTLTATATAANRPPPEVLDRPLPSTPHLEFEGDIEHVASVPYPGGSDLELATIGGRDYVFAGRIHGYLHNEGSYRWVQVVDVTEPWAPVVVSEVKCSLYQNDVQVFEHDGRWILVLAQDNAGGGTCERDGKALWGLPGFVTVDVTDPHEPVLLALARVNQGAHNVTVHPTEPIVYVSNSNLTALNAQIHIWDISDPAAPVRVRDWSYRDASPPHDITFNTSPIVRPDGTVVAVGGRAYAASITHTDIIDTTDPREPSLITSIHHPEIQISHQADPTPDGQFLLVSDEVGGGTFAPVCPGGGVHVWKIGPEEVLEKAPVKTGAFWADPVGPVLSSPQSCTSHVFRVNPDSRTMAIGWYTAGVHVIDFGSLLTAGAVGTGNLVGAGARTIGAMKLPFANTWAAKMWQDRHPGYVFANDIHRGLDVFFVRSLCPGDCPGAPPTV